MRRLKTIVELALLAAIVIPLCGLASRDYNYSVRIGGQYTDFSDYGKKIGEFRHIYDNAYPEIGLRVRGLGDSHFLNFDGQFYDNKNVWANFRTRVSDRLSARVRFQSFRRHLQFDFFDQFNVREEVPDGEGGVMPGGKMISHEPLDSVYDYNFDRYEAETDLSIKLSKKHDFKMIVAHRTIIEKGIEQKSSVAHCFSCHASTRSAPVDRMMNEIHLGIEIDPGPVLIAPEVSYRKFESSADPVSFYFDEAKHPVNGGSQEEFSSRMIYEDSYQEVGAYPETEKKAGKVRFESSSDKRNLKGAISYSETSSESSGLTSSAVGGSLKFSTILTPKIVVYADATASKMSSDDMVYDIPPWREGRQGGDLDIFDYHRYSSYDRLNGRGSIKGVLRLYPKTKMAVQIGYEHTKRHDYPDLDSETSTNRFFGQGSIRYRDGLKFSLAAKYGIEITDEPFMSYKGLFERVGRGVISPENDAPFTFYYQRDRDLRYQNVTTLPTIKHDIDVKGTYRASGEVSFSGAVKLSLDRNDDFDDFDVEHMTFRPSLSVVLTPEPRWSATGGYTYSYNKSTGPVAVAMFDG